MSVFVVFVVGLAVTAALAYWVASKTAAATVDARSVRGRVGLVLQAAFDAFGPLGPFLLAALAGTSATIAVCWPVGKLFGATESWVDVSVFTWAQQRRYDGWIAVQEVLTQMGNRPQIKTVAVVASVVLALLWRKRGWWIPPLAIVSSYGTEKYIQSALGKVVDRGHPPTTLGTYPSGGCARLVVVWGICLVLVTLTWSLSRRVRVLLWTALAVAAYLEGFARTYLLQHWFTDGVGGWLYGSLLLLAFATATTALARYHDQRRRADRVSLMS